MKKANISENCCDENSTENFESKATGSIIVGGRHPNSLIPDYGYIPEILFNKSSKKFNAEDKFRKVKSPITFSHPHVIFLSIVGIFFVFLIGISYSLILSASNKLALNSMQLEVEMLQNKYNSSSKFINQIDQLNDTITLKTTDISLLLGKIKEIDLLKDTIIVQTAAIKSLLGKSRNYPAPSCWAVHSIWPLSNSGYYWVTSSNGTSVRVYCEMKKSCGNITGGLTRIALLNNKNRPQICPGILKLKRNNTRCTQMKSSCSQILFPSKQIPYSHICGLLEGDLSGTPDGFNGRNRSPFITINDNYVDGISLTYGPAPNRSHIWTFIGDEEKANPLCPRDIRSFVGDNYSCLVWDGFCSKHTNPCFYSFFTELQHHVTEEDIEMRICLDLDGDEQINLGNVEIYVW